MRVVSGDNGATLWEAFGSEKPLESNIRTARSVQDVDRDGVPDILVATDDSLRLISSKSRGAIWNTKFKCAAEGFPKVLVDSLDRDRLENEFYSITVEAGAPEEPVTKSGGERLVVARRSTATGEIVSVIDVHGR